MRKKTSPRYSKTYHIDSRPSRALPRSRSCTRRTRRSRRLIRRRRSSTRFLRRRFPRGELVETSNGRGNATARVDSVLGKAGAELADVVGIQLFELGSSGYGEVGEGLEAVEVVCADGEELGLVGCAFAGEGGGGGGGADVLREDGGVGEGGG
jgi:hypothetical protein